MDCGIYLFLFSSLSLSNRFDHLDFKCISSMCTYMYSNNYKVVVKFLSHQYILQGLVITLMRTSECLHVAQ